MGIETTTIDGKGATVKVIDPQAGVLENGSYVYYRYRVNTNSQNFGFYARKYASHSRTSNKHFIIDLTFKGILEMQEIFQLARIANVLKNQTRVNYNPDGEKRLQLIVDKKSGIRESIEARTIGNIVEIHNSLAECMTHLNEKKKKSSGLAEYSQMEPVYADIERLLDEGKAYLAEKGFLKQN